MKNIFGKKSAGSAPAGVEDGSPESSTPDVQRIPLELSIAKDGKPARLKVDLAVRLGQRVVVAGWSTGDVVLRVCAGDAPVETNHSRFPRDDVTQHFGLEAGFQAGFVLVAEVESGTSAAIEWKSGRDEVGRQVLALRETGGLSEEEGRLLGPSIALLAVDSPPHSAEWREAIARLPVVTGDCEDTKAFIEAAYVIEGSRQIVVIGWFVTKPGTHVWAEDDLGNTWPLEQAYRFVREDVHKIFSTNFGAASRRSGFIFHAQASEQPSIFRIKSSTGKGIHLLAESGFASKGGDPVDFARWLFGVGGMGVDWSQRVEAVDRPLLSRLLRRSQQHWDEYDVQVRHCGTPVTDPLVSIIVPLYGRSDFVESQMLEWVRDPWLRQHAQLIYVLDDPAMPQDFQQLAEELHSLYGVPFTWLWGGLNRGYSGANNLGATHANGRYLLFLNSDVFPQEPGWLQPMVQVLADQPAIGAVGPRLLFADGGIQHAGMRFSWRSDFEVYVNEHPLMGLDPHLDTHSELSIVPAVTGACLLIRREDFDRIGGWDTGYLIGDFEDSDLCLKLRSQGLACAYLPNVQLTHLERQSMTALGTPDFRTRVTLWNAYRHQQRWRSLIESPLEVEA